MREGGLCNVNCDGELPGAVVSSPPCQQCRDEVRLTWRHGGWGRTGGLVAEGAGAEAVLGGGARAAGHSHRQAGQYVRKD